MAVLTVEASSPSTVNMAWFSSTFRWTLCHWPSLRPEPTGQIKLKLEAKLTERSISSTQKSWSYLKKCQYVCSSSLSRSHKRWPCLLIGLLPPSHQLVLWTSADHWGSMSWRTDWLTECRCHSDPVVSRKMWSWKRQKTSWSRHRKTSGCSKMNGRKRDKNVFLWKILDLLMLLLMNYLCFWTLTCKQNFVCSRLNMAWCHKQDLEAEKIRWKQKLWKIISIIYYCG